MTASSQLASRLLLILTALFIFASIVSLSFPVYMMGGDPPSRPSPPHHKQTQHPPVAVRPSSSSHSSSHSSVKATNTTSSLDSVKASTTPSAQDKAADDSKVQGYVRPRVVVSFSTFGHRIDRIQDTVESIYNQSRRPDALYLHIPLKIERIEASSVLPPLLGELEKRFEGWLKVTHPKDYGPSTKLLGSLLVEKDPETIIITVDDDMSYHRDVVRVLVGAAELHMDSIPCFICEEWEDNRSIYFEDEGYCNGWGNAFAAMAYRVGFFDGSVFDYSDVPSGCRLHDDVYLSGWSRNHGHRPFVVKPGFNSIIGNKDHTNLSIHSVENTESDYRNPCIQHYNFFRD
ncbi:hypothetical protein HDU67_006386 [Dinochytrium kinnereticum]|nr:hypothetical protein HDU67_006386 [Dinochytrium kinnereticum]